MKITGYADKFSVHPGDTIKFFVNCDGPAEYQAEIVKMIHGDTNPRGPGFIEESIKAECNGTYKGLKQEIYSGSYGFVVDKPQFCVESVTLQCWIWPTTPKTHPEILEARRAGPGDEMARRQGIRPVHQRGRMRRISHQRSGHHDRRAGARSCLAFRGGDVRRRDRRSHPLPRAADRLRARSGDRRRSPRSSPPSSPIRRARRR